VLNHSLGDAGVSSHRRCIGRISEYPNARYSPSGRIGRLRPSGFHRSPAAFLVIGAPYTAYTARPELCWLVRSPAGAANARRRRTQMTFTASFGGRSRPIEARTRGKTSL
jgi:hypothetical protein